MIRYGHKLKTPKEFKSIGQKSRLIIKISRGPLKGAYAYLDHDKERKNISLKPVPQIGFPKRSSGEYQYFLIDQIPEKDFLENNDFNLDSQGEIRIFNCDMVKAIKTLKDKGVTFKVKGEKAYPDGLHDDWEYEIEGKIDRNILRAIAKIGFNYLAYWEGSNFVMYKDFDIIRQYIREGKKPDYPLIDIVDRAMLGDESSEGKRRLGHIITVNWAADKVSIVAQVSLYNWMTYIVCLAKEFSGEHRDITRGHFFNVPGHKIMELGYKGRHGEVVDYRDLASLL
jgi:hypothetical protein